MSIHISAPKADISESVIICGDPLRAQHIAQSMLSDSFCYSKVRGMLGFTGVYRDKKVSVQGTGMGIPSTAIYLHELIHEYGVKRIIRVGTCGALVPNLEVGKIILVTHAFTDSGVIETLGIDPDSVPAANQNLLNSALEISAKFKAEVVAGPVFSTDLFYANDENRIPAWTAKGILAVEMETSVLYTLASLNKIQALTMLTVSDNLATQVFYNPEEREKASSDIMRIALDTIIEAPFS